MRFIHVRKEDGTIINGYSWLYQNVFEPLSSNPKISSLLFALFHLALFWLIGLVLYKKRIFIKV
jgi:predicted acyltransferase